MEMLLTHITSSQKNISNLNKSHEIQYPNLINCEQKAVKINEYEIAQLRKVQITCVYMLCACACIVFN